MITSFISLSLLAWLSFAPAGAAPSSSETSVLAELERLTSEAQPTEAFEATLRAAIGELEADPWAVVGSPEAIDTLFMARLTLVWSLLAREQLEEAELAMDEAIRSSMGRAMPAGTFGPPVLELYDRRRRALREAGMASIHVECETCEVMINEHRSPNPSEPLYLGSYRVWVRGEGRGQARSFDIELKEAGVGVVIEVPWAGSSEACPELGPRVAPAPVVEDADRPALGPLGLSGSFMIVGGVATAVGGGLLMSLPQIIEPGTGLTPQQAGTGMTAVAGIAVVLGVVGLVVDRTVMDKKAGRDEKRERARISVLRGRVEF